MSSGNRPARPRKITRADGVVQTHHIVSGHSGNESDITLRPDTFSAAYASTPIEPDDHQFLVPEMKHLITWADVDAEEASNIAKGRAWLIAQHFTLDDLFDTLTLRTIHQRMFGKVWTWAGSVRRRETSIGIDPSQIQTQFEQLVQNFRWRAANADEIGFSEEERRELGIRFHTEMVAIHAFVNGNGRHARLVANLVDSAMGLGSLADPLYPWGARSGLPSAESRKLYLDAIKLAGSRGEYGPLLDIATS